MSASMTLQFWGVRGSIPSPGPTTVRYGGNTSCVSLALDNDTVLVLDAGTGMRELGKTLASSTAEICVLLSHTHWDHIQGLPFFAPLFQAGRKIWLLPAEPTDPADPADPAQAGRCPLADQMDGLHFPVQADSLPARPQWIGQGATEFLRSRGVQMDRIATNHPGGGCGYRIEYGGRSVVYLTDNELVPPADKVSTFGDFVEFCYQADVLIHDAQYLEQDMPAKHGWGHSLVSQVRELAAVAGVKQLILYHHDPERTDQEIDAIQADTRAWLQTYAPQTQCTAAAEGLRLELEPVNPISLSSLLTARSTEADTPAPVSWAVI